MSRGNRGFTLIEVLIGVMVLSLGLLGLAAVISVVVRQQVSATDQRRGESARAFVKSLVSSEARLIDWDHLRLDTFISGEMGNCNAPELFTYDGEWENDWDWNNNPVGNDYGQYGILTIGGTERARCVVDSSGQRRVVVRVPVYSSDPQPNNAILKDNRPPTTLAAGQRLFPQPTLAALQGAVDGVGPEFVWDIVPRRRQFDGQLQVAVFVRSIDRNIRVSRTTLTQALTMDPRGGSADFRWPVGEDSATGNPTGDGTGVYSPIHEVNASVVTGSGAFQGRWLLRPGTTNPAMTKALRQVGQKVVDNLGLVHTVVDVDPTGALLLTPGYDRVPQALRSEVVQVIFTKQVPVEVFVETIR